MRLFNQIARFIIVGGFSTVVDFSIYMLLSAQFNITISKTLSMMVASVISYVLSKNWAFKSRNIPNKMQIAKFYTVFFINFTANISINSIVFDILGAKIFAFVIATLCAMMLNFLLQRYWVFRQ